MAKNRKRKKAKDKHEISKFIKEEVDKTCIGCMTPIYDEQIED